MLHIYRHLPSSVDFSYCLAQVGQGALLLMENAVYAKPEQFTELGALLAKQQAYYLLADVQARGLSIAREYCLDDAQWLSLLAKQENSLTW